MTPSDSFTSATDPLQRTRLLQQDIDCIARQGGGDVRIPPGVWEILTLHLRSRINLVLEQGAVLKAHGDISLYREAGLFEAADSSGIHLLIAHQCEHVSIQGPGMIDGNDRAFWEPPLRDLKAQGVDITEDLKRMPPHWPEDGPFWRAWGPRISPLLEIRDCHHVTLRNFTIANSPGWTVHPVHCDHVSIDGLTIENHMYGPNTDGIDVDGCRDVRISNCRIACCDDAIILKAKEGSRCCEQITVTNCVLRSNCAALGLGAECKGGFRDITFSNCTVEKALRMIQFQMWSPGLIENVCISNISGRTLTDEGASMEKVVYMDIQQHKQTEPVALGTIRNVSISNITATTRGRCILTAQKGARIENVTLRDIHLHYPEIEDAAQLSTTNRSTQNNNFNPEARAANAVMVAENVQGLRVENLRASLPPAGDGVPRMDGVWLRAVDNLVLDCSDLRANY